MSGLWKRLVERRTAAATRRAEEEQLETPAERRLAEGGVEGRTADEVVEERLGGGDDERLADDQLEP